MSEPQRRTALVVDDEPPIRSVLRAYLEADAFEVVEAGTAAEALDLTRLQSPDIVLLDVGLPDLDGLEVLRRIREHSHMAVILVTARAEETDTLVGLAAGADDYVTKPFSPREVVARVRTVLRRSGAALDAPDGSDPDPDVRRFATLVIDPARREITVSGTRVSLSTLEFDILMALTDAPGRVYTRAQLLEKVWGYDFYGDERVVDVHIRSMRKALGDRATSPELIGTVRGVGYRFLEQPA